MSDSCDSRLLRNLRALAQVEPELTDRLCEPVRLSHLELAGANGPRYRLQRRWYDAGLSQDQARKVVGASGGERPVLIFGVGFGELLEAALEGPSDRSVVAWERDPALLRAALSCLDCSDALRSGRLRLSLGGDLVSLQAQRGRYEVIQHPFFARVYDSERRLLDDDSGGPRVVVCSGGLFVEDLAATLRRMGYSVFVLDIDGISLGEMVDVIEKVDPELVAAINYRPGLVELCHEVGRPLFFWEIDPAIDRLARCRVPTAETFVFTWRRAHVGRFRAAGYTNVAYLPLATDTERRRPVALTAADRERYGGAVGFVGASMLDAARRHLDTFLAEALPYELEQDRDSSSCLRRLSDLLSVQADDFTTFRIPDLLAEHFADYLQAAARRTRGTDPVALLSEMSASEKRLAYVAALGAHGVRVWGDEGWLPVEDFGARYMGEAGHYQELTKIYCACDIQVDIGRLYQSDIVTMRVFDVAACGGFVLAERSEDLDTLFDVGAEVEAYRDLDELLDKVAFYRERPALREQLSERGRRAVNERHTFDRRVGAILAAVRSALPASRGASDGRGGQMPAGELVGIAPGNLLDELVDADGVDLTGVAVGDQASP